MTPTPEEAAAIVAAIEALLAAERLAEVSPPLPAAYRSAWRRAALTPEPFAPAATEPA